MRVLTLMHVGTRACAAGPQPPSTSASAMNLWATFLGPNAAPGSMLSALAAGAGAGVDAMFVKEEGTHGDKGLGLGAAGVLGDNLPSPPMSSTSMAGMIDPAPTTLSGPLSTIFPSMFQTHGKGNTGLGSGVTPPHSADSLSAFLQDGLRAAESQGPLSSSGMGVCLGTGLGAGEVTRTSPRIQPASNGAAAMEWNARAALEGPQTRDQPLTKPRRVDAGQQGGAAGGSSVLPQKRKKGDSGGAGVVRAGVAGEGAWPPDAASSQGAHARSKGARAVSKGIKGGAKSVQEKPLENPYSKNAIRESARSRRGGGGAGAGGVDTGGGAGNGAGKGVCDGGRATRSSGRR